MGIDLEVLGREVKMLDSLIHRVTRPHEAQLLLAMPDSLRELAFLLMWTRKESTLKAWGEGISGMGSLNTLDSQLPKAARPAAPRRERSGQAPRAWGPGNAAS